MMILLGDRVTSGIVKMFFSSIFYHVVLQSIVHMEHGSFTGSVLLFGRSVARKHRRGVLFLPDNTPVHKSNITQVATQYRGFTELNHAAHSSGIAASEYHLFSNLKNFLRGRNFETDDEAIMTVNHCVERVLIFSRHSNSKKSSSLRRLS